MPAVKRYIARAGLQAESGWQTLRGLRPNGSHPQNRCARAARAKVKPAVLILMGIMVIIGFRASGDLEVGINLVLALITVVVIYLGARHWLIRQYPVP